jgi:N-acetyl-anhydromuramyl-L-alanine amidase AmpD
MFTPTLPAKQGDKSQTVSEIQKRLSLLGYDLIIDGDFGKNTTNAVMLFQMKGHLSVDGAVGPKTWDALEKQGGVLIPKPPVSAPEPIDYGSELNIRKDVLQPDSQYIKQESQKSQIFIHFTAGGPSAKNTIGGWNANDTTVSTAYVIDGDTGEAYECFNPKYWSYHLGIQGAGGKLDKASVGIEICAWGPITFKGGKYYTYVNKEIAESKLCKLDKPFRGYQFYHAYSDAQLATVEKLLKKLIVEFKIKVQPSFSDDWFEFKPDVIANVLPGIWTHVNVRKDKTDSYPDKRVLDMLNRLAQEFSGKNGI